MGCGSNGLGPTGLATQGYYLGGRCYSQAGMAPGHAGMWHGKARKWPPGIMRRRIVQIKRPRETRPSKHPCRRKVSFMSKPCARTCSVHLISGSRPPHLSDLYRA